MKIALLSGGSSVHTIRWANGLSEAGLDVHLVSFQPLIESVCPSVRVHILKNFGPIGYFLHVPRVRKLLMKLKPDLVHAHYASGYGTLARLSSFRPFVLSVWGSDVYDFPKKSQIHNWLVKRNLSGADAVTSTSHCMATQVRSILPSLDVIHVIPFGVDLDDYCDSCDLAISEPAEGEIVVGTVKVLAPKYGIDTLIRAFALVHKDLCIEEPGLTNGLKLKIVGEGPQRAELEKLAKSLELEDKILFIGRVEHRHVPALLYSMDIFTALSTLDSESFGVAAVEAGAAGLPSVVSNVGGLPEVILDNVTGLIVKKECPRSAANAIKKLIHDRQLRHRLGVNARKNVQEQYNWQSNVADMVSLYERLLIPPKGNTEI